MFIGLVNYYRDMLSKHSHLLHLLTTTTLSKVKFKCTDVEKKAFDEIKHKDPCDTLLIYPKFIKRFDIRTDASDLWLSSVIR